MEKWKIAILTGRKPPYVSIFHTVGLSLRGSRTANMALRVQTRGEKVPHAETHALGCTRTTDLRN